MRHARRPVSGLVPGLVLALGVAAGGCTADGPGAAPDVPEAAPAASASATTPTAAPSPPTATPSASPGESGESGEPGAADPARDRGRPSVPPALRGLSQEELDRRLLDAAWVDDVARARRLVRAGADVNAKDDTVQSAYLVATSEGYLDLLELALRHGADVDSKDSFNGTGLIRAAERGHADVVGRLLQAGTEVDHVNNLGWTALHEAIVLGDGSSRYVDTVRALVAGGADVTLPSARDGVTPLRHARSRGFDTVAATLRKAQRAEVDRPDRALLAAAGAGDADRAALALRGGADLEARDEAGRTPLLRAAAADRTGVARLLVHLGADPDALDDRHDTPWLVTGVTGSVAMAEILLRADPDLGILNRFGGTALIPAAERGHVAYVRRVTGTGIDVDHVNDLGWTALLEAVILGDGSRRYLQVVRSLLDAGADPTLADRDGVTPLEHARARGQREVAALLARAVRRGMEDRGAG